MKKVIFLLFATLLFVSCASRKQMIPFTPIPSEFPYAYSASAPFRSFWLTFASEVNQNNGWKQFTPSESMINAYPVSKEQELYRVDGTLKVNADFVLTTDLAKLYRLQKITNSFYTFSVPLQSLQPMLELNGIEYVEIAQKSYLRQQQQE